jgi:hypothetical protein
MTYNVTQDRLLHILQWKGEESHRLDIRWYLIPLRPFLEYNIHAVLTGPLVNVSRKKLQVNL